MPLFTDFSTKISAMENNLPKDILPWEWQGDKGKVIAAGPS
jgi:DNA-binding transcriptional regulator PaaX